MATPLYLDNVRYGTLEYYLTREWNSGQSLRRAIKRLHSWYEFKPEAIAAGWEQLKAQYGERPVTFSPARRAQAEAERRKDPAYCEWKGWSGPGAQLRDIIARENASST